MLHVNTREGYTIAVSEAKFIGRVAKRTVLSDSALSVLVPILEDILKWDSARIREVFESFGLSLQEWEKTRTDLLTFQQCNSASSRKEQSVKLRKTEHVNPFEGLTNETWLFFYLLFGLFSQLITRAIFDLIVKVLGRLVVFRIENFAHNSSD
jgi:hypothetical protein